MATSLTVQTEGQDPGDGGKPPVPGLLQIWSAAGPVCRALPWFGELELGREPPALVLDDPRTSRRHCKLSFDGALWIVEDLDSRNGTYIDGARVQGRTRLDEGQVLRVGHCLFLAQSDLRPREGGVLVMGDVIVGAGFGAVLQRVAARAAAGEALLLTGPTGAGKLLAARRFHELAGDGGPFVQVSHKRLTEDSPDAALREAVRVAGSGTLVVAGVDELGSAAQALLLPLCEPGARPRLCVLAREDLRAAVRAGRLREDLYFRLHAVLVEVWPLTRRVEEIGFHIHHELAASQLQAQPSLIEHCVRLPWPGNVRELRAEVRAAGAAAQLEGLVEVAARHLRAHVGEVEEPTRGKVIVSAEKLADPERVQAALRAEGGNVRAAARALGVHRNQLRRWLTHHGVESKSVDTEVDDTVTDEA
jgi:transcriptional regulator of acetoin/glycerol metabolism